MVLPLRHFRHDREVVRHLQASLQGAVEETQGPAAATFTPEGHPFPEAAAQRVPERVPELQGQDAVQDGVDGGAHVVADAGRVGEEAVDDEVGLCGLFDRDGHQPLGVERGPADEEGDHDGHWNRRMGILAHYWVGDIKLHLFRSYTAEVPF